MEKLYRSKLFLGRWGTKARPNEWNNELPFSLWRNTTQSWTNRCFSFGFCESLLMWQKSVSSGSGCYVSQRPFTQRDEWEQGCGGRGGGEGVAKETNSHILTFRRSSSSKRFSIGVVCSLQTRYRKFLWFVEPIFWKTWREVCVCGWGGGGCRRVEPFQIIQNPEKHTYTARVPGNCWKSQNWNEISYGICPTSEVDHLWSFRL